MAQRETIDTRRKAIFEYIDINGKADLKELANLVNATEFTIRRDLAFLENANMVIRTHGGAIKKEKEKIECANPHYYAFFCMHRLIFAI